MERIEQIKVPPQFPLLVQHPSGVVEEFSVHTVTADTFQPTAVIRRFHMINPFIDPATMGDDVKTVVVRNSCEVMFMPPCGHAECAGGSRHVLHLN